MTPLEVGAWVGAVTAGVATIGATVIALRAKWSKADAGIVKERVESRFLDKALDERDESLRSNREIAELRRHDAELLAELRERIRSMEREGHTRQMEFDAYKRRVLRMYPETRLLLESAYLPLDELPPAELLPSRKR